MRRSSLALFLLAAGCAAPAPPLHPALPAIESPPDAPPLEAGWNSMPARPPVPTPPSTERPEGSDALGDVWEEDEENQWQGIWIRRGRTGLFDAYWVHPTGERVLAVVEIIHHRDEVEVRRRHSDGQGCTYRGTIAPNRVDVQGWYKCSWFGHSSPWSAKIIRMRDVAPALLSKGGWKRVR